MARPSPFNPSIVLPTVALVASGLCADIPKCAFLHKSMRPPSIQQIVLIRPSLTKQTHGIQRQWSARFVHYQTVGTVFHQSDSRAHPVGSDVQRGAQAHLAGPPVTQVLSRAKKRRWRKQGSRIPTHSDRPRHPRSPLIEQNMQRWRGVGTNCFPQGTMTRRLSRGMKMATLEGRGSVP